ncbi:hypothetical protein E4T48_08177 [Aureobasidium sp. EXF-10727]|nr:hypothetical protein E4T48_08177 [Aureobasidium sp. EXF-10727]
MFILGQSLAALAAVAVAPFASAAPITTVSRIGASSNGMDILDLQVHAAMSLQNLSDNTTMIFVVDTHTSKITCSGSWAPEGPFPEGEYIPCGNSTLGWNFKQDTFKGLDDFVLQMEYTYTDDSVGPYPYNRVTEFSHANITSDNLDCAVKTCKQCDHNITAIVYAEIA